MTHKITWNDSGIEPTCDPDPKYPNGVHVDLSFNAKKACLVHVPYPAQRIGQYLIECDACGLNAAITTAGRPDDPRTIKLRCKT